MATEGMSVTMEREVYKAAVNGDVTLFSNHFKKDQLLKKTHQNNNILHISAQHEKDRFIKAVLNNFSNNTCETLICEKNWKGNTVLHIAAEVGDEAVVELLCKYYSDEVVGGVLPWRILNSDGNTPAHVALLYGNILVASYLVINDSFIARVVNHSKETLLHLAIRYHVQGSLEEDLWPIIELLLKTDSSVACLADVEGWTPLHIAASLKPPRCLQVINGLLGGCPEAAEVQHEASGKCVLHLLTNHQVPSYEEGVALLNIPEVYALRNCKNDLGDTPLHLAAMNSDRNMVRVLLEFSPKLNIKNKNGVTAASLVQQLCVAPFDLMGSGEILVQGRRKLAHEECEALKTGNVTFLKAKLESIGVHFLASQSRKGGNILHILMNHKFSKEIDEVEEFIGEAIRKCPLLISEKDNSGDTPMHVLAGQKYGVRLLDLCHKHFDKAQEESPWRLRNDKGDTPLHVAGSVGWVVVSRKLVDFDEEVAGYVNNCKKTPLHMLCSYKARRWDVFVNSNVIIGDLIDSMVKGKADLPYMQDEDGKTPLLTAVQDRNLAVIDKLYLRFPKCAEIEDHKGRTLWHMFVYRQLTEELSSFGFNGFEYAMGEKIKCLIEVEPQGDGNIKSLMSVKDNDGNTPLHLAIANRHYEFAQVFLKYSSIDRGVLDDRLEAYLEAENNDGVSSYDLIGSAEHLPTEFEDFLLEEGNVLYGHRSLYGVPTTKIYDYANTIGVVAALLVTITFTAAFTVPGGLNSNNGTPLLLRKAAFQIFILSDVVAMCLSVMVLFCLLWIMTTRHKRESLLLLDVSMFLLQSSIYATLMTFMTGLYVTIVPTVPGIAIFTCVICSLLILLMHKRVVMVTIAPFCGFLIVRSRALRKHVGKKILNTITGDSE